MPITNKFSAGTTGTDYQPNTYADKGNMIGTLGMQIIRETEAKNPMSVFERSDWENGDTLEHAVTKLVEEQGYDPTGAGTLDRNTKEKFIVRLFNNWDEKVFDTTVRLSEIRKVLEGSKSATEVASKLVSVLGQSDTNATYQRAKALLKWGTTNASGGGAAPILKKLPDIAPLADGKTDYDAILKQTINTIKGMQFVNKDYNTANFERSTPLENIYILMPYKLKTDMNVDKLASVFNLDKVELNAKIIELDTPANEKYIYIVDKDAIVISRRLYEMYNNLNAKGGFINYFLHAERLHAISNLFDACFFEYDKAPGK